MRSRFRFFLIIFPAFIFLTSPLNAAIPEPPSKPSDYVVDLAGIINDDVETKLKAYLRELEEKTTAQVLVLTIKSLDGEDIESFSLRTAEKWRLGQKGKDNGLLLTIALEDRRYRFEVGYGLEAILPDSFVGSIGRQYFVPYFRKGDYSSGIFYATLAVIQEIAKHEGVKITAMPELRPEGLSRDSNSSKRDIRWIAIVNIIFIISVLMLRLLIPRRRYIRWYGGFGGFGGGSFGGGFGGFGGGGGGGFGGGGASGRW